jgi:hypothetical protein
MDQDWEQAVDVLVDRIEQELPTMVTRSWLSGKLLELKLSSDHDGAAQMNITVSSSEVIFTAGRGTRFELDPLPGSAAEVLQLVRSVSSGHLTEEIRRGVVTFKLRLDDQTVLTGRSSPGLISRSEEPRAIEYLPYGNAP